jgi:glycerol-3-phosphate acyltransferase PlsY
MTYVGYGLIFIGAYLLGCFSSSYFLGRWFLKDDVRNYGSGNAGATNMTRVFGISYGLLALVMDALKGVIAALVGMWLMGPIGGYVGAIGAIVGHNWPVFMKFKGGKGIATSIGALLVLMPIPMLIIIASLVILLFITGYVSLSSILGALSVPIYAAISGYGGTPFLVFAILVAAMALFSHRQNIVRLIKGEEKRFTWESLKKKAGKSKQG